MNRIIYALFIITFVGACHKKSIPAGNDASNSNQKLLFEQPAVPVEVISIKRTACFGRCPAYTAKFFSDGKVSYKGDANVERRGNYTAMASTQLINSIIKKAMEIKYFDMADVYPVDGEKIADLPTTTTSVYCIGHSKKITNKYKAPDSLKTFEDFIDTELEKLKYTSTDPQR